MKKKLYIMCSVSCLIASDGFVFPKDTRHELYRFSDSFGDYTDIENELYQSESEPYQYESESYKSDDYGAETYKTTDTDTGEFDKTIKKNPSKFLGKTKKSKNFTRRQSIPAKASPKKKTIDSNLKLNGGMHLFELDEGMHLLEPDEGINTKKSDQ